MTKIYNGMTFDMRTGDVLSHGEISYVDNVDQLKGGGGGGSTTTSSSFDSPEVKRLISSGQSLFDQGKFGQVAGFDPVQQLAQQQGAKSAGVQTGIEKSILGLANRNYEGSSEQLATQKAMNDASSVAGMSNNLGGSRNSINQGQIAGSGMAQFNQNKAAALQSALGVQGTGAKTLAGIGSGLQQLNQQQLDSAATGWQQFAGPLTGLSGKTTTSTQSGGGK